MRDACHIATLLCSDPVRWRLLQLVADLGLPDCWIAAGFVRNAVWDALHGRRAEPLMGDVDVIWFDADRADAGYDRDIEATLRACDGAVNWSVKNQARMHGRNHDEPYLSATDAMRYWPETATAVAARRTKAGECEIASPFGLQDLFDCVLRPTPRFLIERRAIFDERVQTKAWLRQWPRLTLAET